MESVLAVEFVKAFLGQHFFVADAAG